MERKDMLKKLASYALTIGIITGSSSILSGCGKNNGDYYYVVFNDNNAIIFDDSVYKIISDGYSGNITVHDGEKKLRITNYIKFYNYSKEETEDQIKSLIGEDGNISYYGFDKEKILKKTR